MIRAGLGLDELKALLVQALEELTRVKTENAALREAIARLKGLKTNGMEKAAETRANGSRWKGRGGARQCGHDRLARAHQATLAPDENLHGITTKSCTTKSS